MEGVETTPATAARGEAEREEAETPPGDGEPAATAGGDPEEVFVPTENISEDISVAFPVDI